MRAQRARSTGFGGGGNLLQAGTMPELPEVETTRRSIDPALMGARLTAVELRRDRMGRRNQSPTDVVDRLIGREVKSVGRRGKFIISEVEGDLTWVIHLGMSGRLQLAQPDEPEAAHTNFMVRTAADVEIRFIDPRTFGFVAVFTPEELPDSGLDRVGRDALTDLPGADEFVDAYRGRVVVIKAALLDQRFVAGLGNIYADEVLHRAKVHPSRRIGDLGAVEIASIQAAIGPVLNDGLRYGGTSLDDLAYLLPDGRAGEFSQRLRVYGREGEECRECGGVIERLVIAQRSSHFCPTCQPVQD